MIRSLRRNPLFIGNAFATEQLANHPGTGAAVIGRNPLFIGNAFATGQLDQVWHSWAILVAIPYSSGMLLLLLLEGAVGTGKSGSQSPIHRKCFCYS